MADNKMVNDLLYSIDQGFSPMVMLTIPEREEVIEAFQMDLIFKSGSRYLLTKEGLAIVKSGRTYDDYLRDRFPAHNPKAVPSAPHMTNSHAGTQLLKKSWNIFIRVINNDWIKFTIITIIGGLSVWYIIQLLASYFK